MRAHWGIENSLHWVLDVALSEDQCRVRTGHAAINLAILRHLALNLLRRSQALVQEAGGEMRVSLRAFCRKHTTVKSTPAQAAGIADHQWTLEEVVEMIDAHFTAKVNAAFETAFVAEFTPQRTKPKTYTPVAPKLPWYLDFEGDGEPDGNEFP